MYHFLRGLLILLALVPMLCAFRMPPQTLLSTQFSKTLLHAAAAASTVEPGKLLYDAAVDGDLEKMKTARKECKGNKDQLNYSNILRYGRTPLVIACYYNNVDAVKLLLSTPGVDVNKGIDFGKNVIFNTSCSLMTYTC